jgi:hypothetical protein
VGEGCITYTRPRYGSLSSCLYSFLYRGGWSYQLPLKMIAFSAAVGNTSRLYRVNGRGGWIVAASEDASTEAACFTGH